MVDYGIKRGNITNYNDYIEFIDYDLDDIASKHINLIYDLQLNIERNIIVHRYNDILLYRHEFIDFFTLLIN
jgi:hypothetical protein